MPGPANLKRWTLLRLARAMRASQRPGWWRQRGSLERGQIAVAFLIVIALILLLAASTMNLGEVARLKTATANAADGGALAGASWVASGENEAQRIGAAMLASELVVQIIFGVPFCPDISCVWPIPCCFMPLLIIAFLILANTALRDYANSVMHAAYDNGRAAALFTAIQNSTIDDPTGAVQAEIRELGKKKPAALPKSVKFKWIRLGADKVPEPSSLEIDVAFSQPHPEMTMDGWPPAYTCYSGCRNFAAFGGLCVYAAPGCCVCICYPYPGWCPGCVFPCWSTTGWKFWEKTTFISSSDHLRTIGQGVTSVISYPILGSCSTCLPIRLSLPFASTTPDDIAHGAGNVTVTVSHHREAGSDVRFWTMKYPDQIRSEATAHYTKADIVTVFDLPKDSNPDSFARLIGVQ